VGGFSHLYTTPVYQHGVPGISTTRGVPDVSGAGQGGIPYTFAADGKTYMILLNGTSGSAPLWGGVLALADQDAYHDLASSTPPSTASPAAPPATGHPQRDHR